MQRPIDEISAALEASTGDSVSGEAKRPVAGDHDDGPLIEVSAPVSLRGPLSKRGAHSTRGQYLVAGYLLTAGIRLERPIGDGGMASVWIAQHINLGVQVAVKLLNENMLSVKLIHERFLEEGPAAAKIKSPHVVQVFDSGVSAGGIPFIVMELLQGETVQQRLEREGKLSVTDTRAIIAQASGALAKAHLADVVHCDVKPDNLFLIDGEPELFVKILDFGIAKRLGEKDSSGIVFGTPQYMAPEQMVAGGELGVESDVWSLGVVAYQCLTATVPFEGDTLEDVSMQIARATYPRASQLRPELPAEIDAWFERCFAQDSSERFHSMHELLQAFDSALSSEPSHARTEHQSLPHATPTDLFGAGSEPWPLDDLARPEPRDSDTNTPFELGADVLPMKRSGGRWLMAAAGVLSIVGVASGVFLTRTRSPAAEQPVVALEGRGEPTFPADAIAALGPTSAASAMVAAPPPSASGPVAAPAPELVADASPVSSAQARPASAAHLRGRIHPAMRDRFKKASPTATGETIVYAESQAPSRPEELPPPSPTPSDPVPEVPLAQPETL